MLAEILNLSAGRETFFPVALVTQKADKLHQQFMPCIQ
jgi:hypothetical protein